MIRLLILAVAMLSGGAALWVYTTRPAEEGAVAQAAVAPAPSETAVVVEEAPVVEVLLAAAPIDPGAEIAPEMLVWGSWPESTVQPDFIQREAEPDAMERAVNLVAPAGLSPREPLRWSRLAEPRPPHLSGNLPQGKRAIAVSVSVENTAGGFVLPNDRVDVIHTFTPSDGRAVSRTVATNVLIIAMDQSTAGTTDSSSVIGRTATLELDPRQVEAVTAAEMSGRLSLALRSGEDVEEESTVVAPPEPPKVIRVIRNGRMETIPLTQ